MKIVQIYFEFLSTRFAAYTSETIYPVWLKDFEVPFYFDRLKQDLAAAGKTMGTSYRQDGILYGNAATIATDALGQGAGQGVPAPVVPAVSGDIRQGTDLYLIGGKQLAPQVWGGSGPDLSATLNSVGNYRIDGDGGVYFRYRKNKTTGLIGLKEVNAAGNYTTIKFGFDMADNGIGYRMVNGGGFTTMVNSVDDMPEDIYIGLFRVGNTVTIMQSFDAAVWVPFANRATSEVFPDVSAAPLFVGTCLFASSNVYELRIVGGTKISEGKTYPKNVVALGDSLVRGGAAAGSYSLGQVLGNLLDIPFNFYGYSGQTTATILGHADEALTQKPTHVLIEGGINDIYGGVPNATIKANLSAMIQKAITAGSAPVLLCVTPCTAFTDAQAVQRQALNADLLGLTATFPTLKVYDVSSTLGQDRATQAAGNYNDLKPAYSIDGTHFNLAGANAAMTVLANDFR